MSKSDQWINITLVGLILIYLSVLIIVIVTNKIPWLTSLLNLVAGLSIILYWIQKEMRIQQHTIELREIIVLCFEVVVIGCVIYFIVTNPLNNRLKIIQQIFFGIHLLCLVLFLVFMLTFKINRLI